MKAYAAVHKTGNSSDMDAPVRRHHNIQLWKFLN